MKFNITRESTEALGQLGPTCIACGNSRVFVVLRDGEPEVAPVMELPDGEAVIVACGRCRSRNSVIIGYVD